MSFIRNNKNRLSLLLISVMLVSISLYLYSCGGGGYDAPSTTTTSTALVSADTLKEWVDSGRVNGTGYDRVVALDVNSISTYSTGHILGAQFLDSNDIYQTRTEGPATDINMVLDGPHMDALIQKYGIDNNTTIVFTSGTGSCGTGTPGAALSATRAYWTFRYWGFPKERLKVLDGINCDYGKRFGLTTDPSPAITPSAYSVRNNTALRSDLRASLREMIDVASGTVPNALIIDARGPSGSYAGTAGSTPGVFPPTGDFVVFEGHIKGAKALSFTAHFDPTNNYRFLSADALIAQFAAIGLDSTKTAYVHCRTGVIASAPFFVLDGILGWPVANYDGSWSQWGQMSASSANGGQLSPTSPWITDTLSENVTYNFADGKAVELLTLDGSTCSGTMKTDGTKAYSTSTGSTCTPSAPNSFATSGNQIEEADANYMGSGGGAPGGSLVAPGY